MGANPKLVELSETRRTCFNQAKQSHATFIIPKLAVVRGHAMDVWRLYFEIEGFCRVPVGVVGADTDFCEEQGSSST